MEESNTDSSSFLPQFHPEHPFANFEYPPQLLAQWIILFILMVIGYIYLNKAAYQTPQEIVAAQTAQGQAPETEGERKSKHDSRVTSLSTQIAGFHRKSTPFRISHGSTNSTRTTHSRANQTISTGPLKHIISINRTTMTCTCEPNVPMDALLDACTDLSLLPKVVPEFPGITVGGAFAGTAGESSSFKHGFFDNTVSSIEIILATGEILHASPTNHPDLFHGAAGTFGTLGVITLLEIQLLDITDTKMVKLTYHPITSVASARDKILHETGSAKSNDFVDGILFSPTSGLVITGVLDSGPKFVYPPPPKSETATDLPTSTFLSAVDPWFYLHAQKVLKTHPNPQTSYVELVPIKDYLFRYDRSAFWMARYAYTYFLVPFNPVTRWLFDYFMHARVMYRALHTSGLAQTMVIQDLILPLDTVSNMVEWTSGELGIWPVWLCPLRVSPGRGGLRRKDENDMGDAGGEMMINVGLWGAVPPKSDFVEVTRNVEAVVKQQKGWKWLYAQNYYTETEFWGIYDRAWYEELRREWKAEGLVGLYQKIRVDGEGERARLKGPWGGWPWPGVWGVGSVIKAGVMGEFW